MLKKVLLGLVCTAFLSGIACQSASAPNSPNKQNGNVSVDPKNMPPGLSTVPVTPGTTPIPGIPDPANVNKLPKGVTATPGIPDAKSLGKPLPKGVTPTPGIPDEATRKRQMTQPSDMNMQAPPTGDANGVPTSGDSRSRKVNSKKP